MKLVDNKFSMTLLQHYLHNLYNILTVWVRYYWITGLYNFYNFYSQVFLWITFLRESAPVCRISVVMGPDPAPSHSYCTVLHVVIGHDSATSQSCWQHRYHTAYCTARTLCCIAPINPPLSTLPGSPELLIFSPLEATAVAKGWQCSNLRVTHPHLPSHQQTSLL